MPRLATAPVSELMDARASRPASESACKFLSGDDASAPLRSWLFRGLPMRPPSTEARRARGGLSARSIARARSLAPRTAASAAVSRFSLESSRRTTNQDSTRSPVVWEKKIGFQIDGYRRAGGGDDCVTSDDWKTRRRPRRRVCWRSRDPRRRRCRAFGRFPRRESRENRCGGCRWWCDRRRRRRVIWKL